MVNTIMRTQSALTTLPFIKPENETLLTEWLHQMLFPMNPTMDDPKVSLSTSIEADRVTCWADNELDILKVQLLEFIQASKFKEIEEKALKMIVKGVPDGRLSAWLQLTDGGQETGWVMDGVFPLEKALKIIPKCEAKNNLEAWYKKYGADACIRVGRSMAGNRFAILHTELFGETALEDVQLYIDLMAALNLSPLPDVLLELIAEENPEFIELSFWIGNTGILKAGLVIPEPSDVFVRQMALVYAEESADTLAAFEGSIGADAPAAMQLSREAAGVKVDLIY